MGLGKFVKKVGNAGKKVGKIVGKVGKAQIKSAKSTHKNIGKFTKNAGKSVLKGDLKGVAKAGKTALSEQNKIRKKNFHETIKPISENKYTNMIAQAAASYFGGPLGGAAYGAASAYENSGGNWGKALAGGGMGYLGGKGMQNAGFTYGQNGYTNLMNGTLGAGAGGTAARGFRGDGVINPLNGGGSILDNNWGNIASNALGGQSNDTLGKINNARSLAGGDDGGTDWGALLGGGAAAGALAGGGGSGGGGTDWGSLLGQAGGALLGGIGADKGAKAYQETINEGIKFGKGLGKDQLDFANQVPGQINQYMPATQGQVAYEPGTERSPYFAQGNAYGQQLSDILSGKSDWKQDPGYQFRMQQGQQETERNAASRGYNQSGNIMAALQDRAQGTASAEYGTITDRLKSLQDQYAGQDINATNIMSGDRQNNANNRTTFINSQLGNQAGYRQNAGLLGGGIMDMYANRANADADEEQAPYAYGRSALGGILSDPTRNGGVNSNNIGNIVSAGKDIWDGAKTAGNYIADIWKNW